MCQIPLRPLSLALLSLLLHFMTTTAVAQQTFATPQEAADALSQAAESEDPASFTTLFGAPFTQEISSGDPQADRLGIQRLATLMRQGYELSPENPYKINLQVGADGWPFPLPIARTTKGEWGFNVQAGKEALLQRRIEKNEERAIKIAAFYATAQNQYKKMAGVYAPKFQSSSNAKDGLYWETSSDGIVSPIEPLITRIANLGYQRQGRQNPILAGYTFRVLTAQGEYAPGKSQSYLDGDGRMTKGFGLIAYPSRYAVSGKMSFIVGKEGLVYQRDLGTRTEELGTKINRFDPDPSWAVIGGDIQGPPKKVKYINTDDGVYPFYND